MTKHVFKDILRHIEGHLATLRCPENAAVQASEERELTTNYNPMPGMYYQIRAYIELCNI
jgi:hypothetical protein